MASLVTTFEYDFNAIDLLCVEAETKWIISNEGIHVMGQYRRSVAFVSLWEMLVCLTKLCRFIQCGRKYFVKERISQAIALSQSDIEI